MSLQVLQILLLTCKALNGLTPSCTSSLIFLHTLSRPLHSLDAYFLTVPPFNKNSFGGQAIAHQAPFLRSNLPLHIQEARPADDLRSRLKTSLVSVSAQRDRLVVESCVFFLLFSINLLKGTESLMCTLNKL